MSVRHILHINEHYFVSFEESLTCAKISVIIPPFRTMDFHHWFIVFIKSKDFVYSCLQIKYVQYTSEGSLYLLSLKILFKVVYR